MPGDTYISSILPGGSAAFTPVLRWRSVVAPAGSAAFPAAGIAPRKLVGRRTAVSDPPPRGTSGLMPPEWGKVDSFDIDDAGTDFEYRLAHGKLLAGGQSSGRLTIAMTLRMAASAPMPERGQTFRHPWRGEDRLFVVWSVSPVWRLRGLRLVEVTARHELDLGDREPGAVTEHPYSLTLT